MKVFRDVKLGWVLARNPREVLLMGPCSCGCGVNKVLFRGVFHYLSERHYRRLAKIIEKLRLR